MCCCAKCLWENCFVTVVGVCMCSCVTSSWGLPTWWEHHGSWRVSGEMWQWSPSGFEENPVRKLALPELRMETEGRLLVHDKDADQVQRVKEARHHYAPLLLISSIWGEGKPVTKPHSVKHTVCETPWLGFTINQSQTKSKVCVHKNVQAWHFAQRQI